MQIKEIKTHKEVLQASYFLTHFYDKLEEKHCTSRLLKMIENGYKIVAAFENQSLYIIGLCGFRITEKLQHGKTLEIEDFAIESKKSANSIEKALFQFIAEQAATFGCKNIISNLATNRIESQKIFTGEKFILDGFLFRKTF